MDVNERIELLREIAHESGRDEVIRIVRKIIDTNPKVATFHMAMGTYVFSNAYGDSLKKDSRFTELDDFMDKWDEDLHLTGQPLKILCDGQIDRNY